jgi:carbon monoxide dehydrogenase subunit G
MAIEIKETFQVRAPIETVWRFVMDPQSVVTCMPGASLDEVVDARNFLGTVKVKVGAITTSYKGKVQFTDVNEQAYALQMVAEGRETGGGMAKGTMSSRLRSLADGQTEVVAEASVDLTGRIMQVGRGMIQGVAHQLFQQFAARMKERLEAAQAATAQGSIGSQPPAATEPDPIRVLPLVLNVFWSAIVGFFRRLFGRSAERR